MPSLATLPISRCSIASSIRACPAYKFSIFLNQDLAIFQESPITSTISVDDPDHDAYDDVGPSLVTSRPVSPESTPVIASDEQVYDDVMPLRRCDNSYDQIPLVCTDESKKTEKKEEVDDEEEQPDEDVYDDVGLPTVLQSISSEESHERINSIYAGSSLAESIQMAYGCLQDKESDWEDDDAEIYGLDSG